MKNSLIYILFILTRLAYTQDFNFFDCPKKLDVDYYEFKTANNKLVIVPYCEVIYDYCPYGEFCLFAYSKSNNTEWIDSLKDTPCGYNPNNLLENINCLIKPMFSKDNHEFKKHLDYLCFFIDKVYLEGPYYETSEFGDGKYFKIKENAVMKIYKLENNRWIQFDEQPLNDDIPRTFGEKYMLDLLKLKF